ncbi:MAG: TIGR03435 family protein [Bryobacteraceae bacterium]
MKLILLPVLAGFTIFGQAVQFEVASIRPSAATGADHVNVGVHIDGARISCTQLSLKDYISAAYQVKLYQISGPDWVGSERFDIAATLPPGAKEDQVPDMLKALLEDRFQMKFHREKKDFPVYALVIAKSGLRLNESEKDPEAPSDSEPAKAPVNVTGSGGRGGVHINLGNGSYFTLADNKFIGRKLTMAGFVDMLARFEDRPVVDMTDLKGMYDIDLQFTEEDYRALLIRSAIAAGVVLPPEAMKALESSSGDSLLAALEKVGLKLEGRKAPLDVLVIDSMRKAPTEN